MRARARDYFSAPYQTPKHGLLIIRWICYTCNIIRLLVSCVVSKSCRPVSFCITVLNSQLPPLRTELNHHTLLVPTTSAPLKSQVTGFDTSARADSPYLAPQDSPNLFSITEAAAGDQQALLRNSYLNQKAIPSWLRCTFHLPPRAILVIGNVARVTVVSSMSTGILTVALSRMAEDVHLANSLLLWPSSVFALTCGCFLLVLGSLSDLFVNRNSFCSAAFA